VLKLLELLQRRASEFRGQRVVDFACAKPEFPELLRRLTT
jgi:hypothetical protein